MRRSALPDSPLTLLPADPHNVVISILSGVLTVVLLWAVAKGWRWLGRTLRESSLTSRERARRYAERLAESDIEYTESLADHRAATTQQAVYMVGFILFTTFAGYAGMGLLNPALWVAVVVMGSGLTRATNARNRIADAFKAAGYTLEFGPTTRVLTTNYDDALEDAARKPKSLHIPETRAP